jgi:predicted nucleotidyltransferase component of viral defense system
MARKFIALYNRLEGKDIYDLFYCLEFDFNRARLDEAIRYMVAFYKLDGVDFQKELLLRLQDARKNAYYIGNTTNHFIPRDLRPAWAVFIDTLLLNIKYKCGW